MTVLTILGGDWEYQFEDEFVAGGTGRVGTRMLVYNSGPVRDTVEVYSAVADAMDEFQAMGFKNPMLPVTPNAFTMENQAFISRASSEWLREGTITANWTAVTVPDSSGNGVLRVPYTQSVAFVPGDIGREVTSGADNGTLLDYEVEPDGTTVLWIRPSVSLTDTWVGTGAIATTGGTGAASAHVAATGGGVNQFTAIQAIGAVPTATEVYIVQNRIKLANSTDNTGFQFWATDPNVSLGIISVLIRTTSDGSVISGGDLEVFARKYGALYDNFRLNVAAGGFSALPLASAPDINNTTGYRRNVMTGSSGTWNVGNLLYVGTSFAAATMKGVITAESAGTIEYYLVGDLTDLTGSEAIKEYDPVAEGDGDATATGAAGGSIDNPGGPTETGGTGGGDITITIGHTTSDFDNTGVAEPYSVTVNCDSKATGIVYERLKYVTRRGSDNTFWDTVASSIPGEQYRGLEALYTYTVNTGSLLSGEDVVNETQAGAEARVMAANLTPTGEGTGNSYITVADYQPSTLAAAISDVIADSGSTDDITIATITSITSPKSSPFGTYTGTQIFGAPGILYTALGSGDSQNYILTDDLLTLRSPPNTITYTVANTRAGDRILVARDTGTAGVIDRDQFGGMTAVAASSKTITVGGTIDSEVPPGSSTLYSPGYIRVVENALQEEHKYYYDSRTTTVFNLRDITAASATVGTSETQLSQSANTFVTDKVEVGMLIHVASRSSTYEVVSVTNGTTLVIRLLYGAGGFVSGDPYTINETIQLYATSDDIYDLIVDAEEDTGTDGTPGTISNTLVKTPAANFGTVVQVRLGKTILPFELNQTQGDGDTSVTTVRTPDTIAV